MGQLLTSHADGFSGFGSNCAVSLNKSNRYFVSQLNRNTRNWNSNTMKRLFCALLAPTLVSTALLFTPPSARATSVTYDLTFLGVLSSFGSGTATFSDTLGHPGSIITGSTRYDFTSVAGSGGAGNWLGSFFEYNSTTGGTFWELDTANGGVFSGPTDVATSLSPIMALEANFDYLVTQQDLSWRRQPETVPDSGKTAALLGLGLLTLATGRFLQQHAMCPAKARCPRAPAGRTAPTPMATRSLGSVCRPR